MVVAKARKGVTPIIATIVLLLITMGLLGGAWAFLSGFTNSYVDACIDIPASAQPLCDNDIITVYAYNCGTKDMAFPAAGVVSVNGIDVSSSTASLKAGKAGMLLDGYRAATCLEDNAITVTVGAHIIRRTAKCECRIETECSDGIDNDGDGKTDGLDDDCFCKSCACNQAETAYAVWPDCNPGAPVEPVYVDCTNDRCWTPSLTTAAWSTGTHPNYDCIMDDCTSGGTPCPACNYCDALNYGGLDNWRLPDSSTLQALCQSPMCPSGLCFGETGTSGEYWSSTQNSPETTSAWTSTFPTQCISIGGLTKANGLVKIRCVTVQTPP